MPADAAPGDILLDASAWQPADVLLFSSRGAGTFSSVIETVQSPTFGRFAEWTHAALYIGNGELIEAIAQGPKQVVQRSIACYPPTRPVLRLHHPTLSGTDRAAIIAHARSRLGTPYAFREAIALGLQSLGYRPRKRRGRKVILVAAPAPVREALFCSLLVEDAFIAIGETAAPGRAQLLLPAALAESTVFQQTTATSCHVPVP